MAPEQLREHRGSRAVRAKDRADAPRLDARRHLRPPEDRGERGAGAGVEREAVHELLRGDARVRSAQPPDAPPTKE